MFRSIFRFFDRFEDRIRHRLSKHPIVYALIGGAAIVLFWRGVEMTATQIGLSWWASLLISIIVMLSTGTLVSFFIGEQILISGLKEEKKTDEKTEDEVRAEEMKLRKLAEDINEIHEDVAEIKKMIGEQKSQIKK